MSDHDDTAPLLDIRDLVIRFGDRTVVDGVSLRVGRGETLALVGESGSGKSLTARAVLGLLPDGATVSGSIRLDGTEIVGAAEAELRPLRGTRAAMVFQEPQTALNPVQRIGTQIAEALRAHGRIGKAQARARAVELLGLVEIPEPEKRVDWYPHQLSGGQKQRVVIALALSGEPELLIADEPTTALDVTVQAEILELLRDLQRRNGTAVLFITHNLGVVAAIADRVTVLRAGRVVETQPVRELFAAPREDYTRELLAAVPLLPDAGAAASDVDADVKAATSVQSGAAVVAIASAPQVAATSAAARVDHRGLGDDGVHGGESGGRGEPEPVLEISDLSVVYRSRGRKFQALHEVSLTLAPREVVGLVGESGSGKSTLGRAALGLVPASSGRVVLQGIPLTGLSQRDLRGLRKQVALVHQDVTASLNPRRSVVDAIGEPLVVHRAASGALLRAKVGELLESVRLPREYAQRRPGNSPAGSGSGSRWRGRWLSRRGCWWPTNPPVRWMCRCRRRCWSCSRTCVRNMDSRAFSSVTIWPWCIRWRIGCWCCGRGVRWNPGRWQRFSGRRARSTRAACWTRFRHRIRCGHEPRNRRRSRCPWRSGLDGIREALIPHCVQRHTGHIPTGVFGDTDWISRTDRFVLKSV